MSATLILASASPRRRDLLAARGVRFEVVPSSVEETPRPGEPPEAFAQRIAREKACDVAQHRPGMCVLAADTVVIAGASLFGKPTDRDDARRTLRALSGRTHRVLTAVAFVDADGHLAETAVESEVEFRRLTGGEIEAYLDSGEPFDKAGAYAIQGLAQEFVTAVRGSYSNVIGLPMDEVLELLRRHCPSGMTAGTTP
jgi:septum formation protein